MLQRGSFYARHQERRRRDVVARLRRDVPELRVEEPVSLVSRAGVAVATAVPLAALLTVVLLIRG